MAALSYKQGAEGITHCYIKTPQVSNELFQMFCSPGRNKTVEKVCYLFLFFLISFGWVFGTEQSFFLHRPEIERNIKHL